MWKNFKYIILMGTSTFALAACGGSSSSSSGATVVTPPPAPVNVAPTASISVTDMSPNEGKSSTLDASGSSDPDGDNLTYSWTQLSGTDLVISAPTGVQTEISVPNLTADTPARIQLQVSDGMLTSTEEVTLTLTNVVLTPVANSTITGEETLSFPNKISTIPNITYFFDTINYLVYESMGRYIWDALYYNTDDSILEVNPSMVESEPGKIVQASVNSSPSFAVLSTNKVSFFATNREPTDLFSIDIDQPCSLVSGPNFTIGNMVVGQLNGGATLIELSTDSNFEATGVSAILQSFGDTASFCEMQIMQGTLNGDFYSGEKRLITFDQNTHQLFEYSIVENDSRRMIGVVENAVIPVTLDLPTGASVEFITSTKIDSVGNKGLALVFSNGETDGLHRLVIVGLSQDGSISQETYSWTYGAPSGISHAYVDDHQGDSLLIATIDSPHAVIFKSGGFFAEDTPYLPLSGPSYFDLGIGHDLVAPVIGGSPRRLGTLVTFPDQNLIKVLERE